MKDLCTDSRPEGCGKLHGDNNVIDQSLSISYITVQFLSSLAISHQPVSHSIPSTLKTFTTYIVSHLALYRHRSRPMAFLFAVATLVGLAAASPAAHAFDLGVIGAAPIPTVTAAPLASVIDTISYNPTDAAVLGSSVANSVGTAVAKVKRGDGGCWGYGGWGPKPSTKSVYSYSYSPSPSPSKSTSQTSGTATTSSTTACPTVPEAGTYCGFINPEDPCAPQPDGWSPKPHCRFLY